jgi:DNA-binding beta-propeller fold protein YncE
MKRTLLLFAVCLATAGSVVIAQRGANSSAAPKYEVVPLWPKPFPAAKAWILGSVTGVTVDPQDRVWVVHRGVESLQTNEKGPTLEPWASSCCFAAPQVLVFDAAGDLVSSWEPKTGTGYDWPANPSGIAIDAQGNVWIGSGIPPQAAGGGRGGRGRGGEAAPPPPADAQVLKFDKAGKFLLQIGKGGKPEGPDSPTGFNRPAGVFADGNELFVADMGNRRIVVLDTATGAFKRSWGAYGEKPGEADAAPYDPAAPPSKQFRTVSCVKVAKDGTVYVCDRQNDRIQVFQKDGKFVKEAFVSKNTTGDGSVWDIAFSPDQRQLLVADGHDKKIWVLDRASLEVVGSFGSGGRYPGQFYGVDAIAVDSKGTVYTGETYEGKRVQKFAKR